MKGRYWVGVLGALGAGTVTVLTSFVLPMCCGVIGLGVTIVVGIIAGFIVAHVDDGVKASPDEASGAGALVGLLIGLGGAVGQVAAALLFSWMLSSNPDVFVAQFNIMIDDPQYSQSDMSAEDMVGLVKVSSDGMGICYGILSVALTVGASAMTAHLAKPARPDRVTSETLPAWGMEVEQDGPPPPEPPAPGGVV